MKYPGEIVEGKFIRRKNRFVGEVRLKGKKETVHIRNTGRCRELLLPGATVYLEDCLAPHRKTRYSLVAVKKGDMLVNMDSQIPNRVVEEALLQGRLSFSEKTIFVREKSFGHSRFDFAFEQPKGFMEVKGVTLEEKGIAMFPDAPTERGTKHIRELMRAKEEGYEAYVFFLIQMKGPHLFTLNWSTDPVFSQSVVEAEKKGVKIMVYDSLVTPQEIILSSPLPYDSEAGKIFSKR